MVVDGILRIPKLVDNIDWDIADSESVMVNIEEISYTKDQVKKILQDVEDKVVNVMSTLIYDREEVLVIVDPYDKMAIAWHIYGDENKESVILYNGAISIIFTSGSTKEPVVALLP